MEELEPKNDPKSIQEYVEVYRKSSELEWGELGKHNIFDETLLRMWCFAWKSTNNVVF